MTTYQCCHFTKGWEWLVKSFEIEFDPNTMLYKGDDWWIEYCSGWNDVDAVWEFCSTRNIKLKGFYVAEVMIDERPDYELILHFETTADLVLFKLSWP